MDPAICIAIGGCTPEVTPPRPESAYELVVEGTTFTVYPEVPEYTIDMETLYAWGELKRK